MASFALAHAFVTTWEGGYSNDSIDRGGETIFGISRRAHPDWPGWSMVDSGAYDIHNLKLLAADLYRREYWGPIWGDQIESQRFATCIYQAAVNCGVRRASTWAQRACNAANPLAEPIKVDGRIGNHTLHAMHEIERQGITGAAIEAFKTQQRQHYLEIVEDDPTQRKFLNGWFNRVNAA